MYKTSSCGSLYWNTITATAFHLITDTVKVSLSASSCGHFLTCSFSLNANAAIARLKQTSVPPSKSAPCPYLGHLPIFFDAIYGLQLKECRQTSKSGLYLRLDNFTVVRIYILQYCATRTVWKRKRKRNRRFWVFVWVWKWQYILPKCPWFMRFSTLPPPPPLPPGTIRGRLTF